MKYGGQQKTWQLKLWFAQRKSKMLKSWPSIVLVKNSSFDHAWRRCFEDAKKCVMVVSTQKEPEDLSFDRAWRRCFEDAKNASWSLVRQKSLKRCTGDWRTPKMLRDVQMENKRSESLGSAIPRKIWHFAKDLPFHEKSDIPRRICHSTMFGKGPFIYSVSTFLEFFDPSPCKHVFSAK